MAKKDVPINMIDHSTIKAKEYYYLYWDILKMIRQNWALVCDKSPQQYSKRELLHI